MRIAQKHGDVALLMSATLHKLTLSKLSQANPNRDATTATNGRASLQPQISHPDPEQLRQQAQECVRQQWSAVILDDIMGRIAARNQPGDAQVYQNSCIYMFGELFMGRNGGCQQ